MGQIQRVLVPPSCNRRRYVASNTQKRIVATLAYASNAKFVNTFRAFARDIDWNTLPPALREAIESSLPSTRTGNWIDDPASFPFFNRKKADGEDLACEIYRTLSTLSDPDGSLAMMEKTTHLIHFHLVREGFKDRFHARGNLDPLADYISRRLPSDLKSARENCHLWGRLGARYHSLAEGAHPGLPLFCRIPPTRYLMLHGVCRNDHRC